MLRRIGLTLALLLALASPCAAFPGGPIVMWPSSSCTPTTPAHVQGAAGAFQSGTSTTYVLSLPAKVTSSDAVFGSVAYAYGPAISTIKDDQNNSYTIPAHGTASDTTDGESLTQFYALGITNAPKTITVTFSTSATNVQMVLDEYSSIASFDQSAIQYQAAPGTGSNAVTSGNATTLSNGELIYGSSGQFSGAGTRTLSAGTSFTRQQNSPASGQPAQASESLVQASAGTTAATFTTSVTGNDVAGVMTFAPRGCASAPSYTFTGPNTGTVGVPGTYTVEAGASLGGSVTVTPASANGGTFSPTTVVLPSGSPTAETFTFTPANAGTYNLATTNSGGLANPPAISFTATGGSVTALYIAPATAIPAGNDSNACTITAPCLTLAHCYTQMAASSTKTCYARAGTYTTLTSPVTVASAVTFAYYPGDGVNTATFNGGNATQIFNITSSNVTINGLKVTNCLVACINSSTGSGIPQLTGLVIENNDCSLITQSSSSACLLFGNTPGIKILNNYIHNVGPMGISLYTYYSGQSWNGAVISGNYVEAACQATSDCGGIYWDSNGSLATAGTITVSGNYVGDSGTTTATTGYSAHCYYADDNASNATVTGNVCAPALSNGTGNLGNNGGGSTAWLVHGGNNNVFQNNVIDLGNRVTTFSGLYFNKNLGMTGNVESRNIVLSNSSATTLSTNFSGTSGVAYYSNADSVSITGNQYWNIGTGHEFSNGGGGSTGGDASPTTANPGCSATYSSITNPPAGWTTLNTSWGPPGFTPPAAVSPRSC